MKIFKGNEIVLEKEHGGFDNGGHSQMTIENGDRWKKFVTLMALREVENKRIIYRF